MGAQEQGTRHRLRQREESREGRIARKGGRFDSRSGGTTPPLLLLSTSSMSRSKGGRIAQGYSRGRTHSHSDSPPQHVQQEATTNFMYQLYA